MSKLQGIKLLYPYTKGSFEDGYDKTVPFVLVNYWPATGEVTRQYGRKVAVITVSTATNGFFLPGGRAEIETPHFRYGLNAGKNVLKMTYLAGNLLAQNYWLCTACFRLTGKMGLSRFGPGNWQEEVGAQLFLMRQVQCSECTHMWTIKTFGYRQS